MTPAGRCGRCGVGVRPLDVQVGEVAFEQFPVDASEAGEPSGLAEDGEAAQRAQPASNGLDVQPGPQPPAQPPLQQVGQPRLGDHGEVESLVAFVAEPSQLPDVAAELAFPAVAVGEVGQLAVCVDQKRPWVGVFGGGTVADRGISPVSITEIPQLTGGRVGLV